MKLNSTYGLSHVQELLWEKRNVIDKWIKAETEKRRKKLPFYCSIDIRHSGVKISVVDTNLFPAGFNNISEKNEEHCIRCLKGILSERIKKNGHVLILAENHTRNSFYLKNLSALKNLIEQAGFQSAIGHLPPSFPLPDKTPQACDDATPPLMPLIREGKYLLVAGNTPDLILLNNDLSSGLPQELMDLDQPITPPVHAGWFFRKKKQHLELFNEVASRLCDNIGIDPIHLTTQLDSCPPSSLKTNDDRFELYSQTKRLLTDIHSAYEKQNISDKPFVVIKTDPGTYGMGVICIESEEDILNMNWLKRKKLLSTKNGASIKQFILQEGIPTCEEVNQKSCEHTLCAIGDTVVGGFLRINHQKGKRENLNSPGMTIMPFDYNEDIPAHFCMGTMARLALLAVTEEPYHTVK